MRRFSLTASIVPVALAGVLACAPGAAAAPPPPMSVTVQSANGTIGNYFQVAANPGQVVRAGTIRLKNQSTKQVTVMLDPVGALTASTLGSAYALRGTHSNGPSSWTVLGERRVVLAPHGGARVPVSVSVPSSATPGDYLAGISVQAAGPASNVQLHGNLAISNIERYAVGLETRLPGARSPLVKLTDVKLTRQPAGVTFSILGRNGGNEILKNVQGVATVSNGDTVVARRKLGPGTFVTGTSIAYPLLVPSLHPNVGAAFRVRAYLRYAGGIARINKVVRFGQIDAKRQQEYGGPKVQSSGGGGSNPLPILLIVAAAAACLAIFELRRRRQSAGDRALRRTLPRVITRARASGEPLSVILVLADGGRSSRKLVGTVSGSLRHSDQLFRLNGSGLMVVSPDTTPQAGETLAAEIRRHLARTGGGAAVVPVTNAAQSSAEELLEAAAAGAEAPAPRNGSGNGSNGSGNGTGHAGAAASEVRSSGTEAPAVGGHDATRRSP